MQQARCYLLGERAVVLELTAPATLTSQQRIWGMSQQLQQHTEVAEVIPGMNNLTVLLHHSPQTAADATDWLQHCWQQSASLQPEARNITVPVIYGGADGADLEWVAQHSGLTPAQVVECHSAAEYVVFFLGFKPGFPYLSGLDTRLHTPRRAVPRVQVPAGSVGIGGSQTGIYPLDAPGGWQLIGRTALALFTPQQQPPVMLRPGDRLRFVPQKEGVC